MGMGGVWGDGKQKTCPLRMNGRVHYIYVRETEFAVYRHHLAVHGFSIKFQISDCIQQLHIIYGTDFGPAHFSAAIEGMASVIASLNLAFLLLV